MLSDGVIGPNKRFIMPCAGGIMSCATVIMFSDGVIGPNKRFIMSCGGGIMSCTTIIMPKEWFGEQPGRVSEPKE